MKLQLIVKQPWFGMEASGIKTEEYRDITGYWVKRLLTSPLGKAFVTQRADEIATWIKAYGLSSAMCTFKLNPIVYEQIEVYNGYQKTRLTWSTRPKGLTVGRGRTDWGAPEYDTFILKI
ncbi:MAG: hypothetical protein RR410_04745 [Alistipes sp.]